MLTLNTDAITNRVAVSVVHSSISHDLFRYISYSGLVANKVKCKGGLQIVLTLMNISFEMQQELEELSNLKNQRCHLYKVIVAKFLTNIETSYTLWNVLLSNRSLEGLYKVGHTNKALRIHRTAHMLLDRIAKNILTHSLNKRVMSKNGHVLIEQNTKGK